MLRILMLLFFGVVVAAEEYSEPSISELTSQKAAALETMRSAELMSESPDFVREMGRDLESVDRVFSSGSVDAVGFSMPKYVEEMNKSDYLGRALSAGQQSAATSGYESQFLALVSFSMPIEEVLAIARRTTDLGGVVVIRGLVNGDMNKTVELVAVVAEAVEGVSISIDPTIFSRFGIQAVPAYVLSVDPVGRCTQDGCPVPRHVSAVGSVSPDYFMDLVGRVSEQEDARRAANSMLKGRSDG